MTQHPLVLLVLFLFVLLPGCTGEPRGRADSNVDDDKLGRQLHRLVRGDTTDVEAVQVGVNAEGEPMFAVFLRVTDPEVFRESDIPVSSWSGNIATARLTVEQIRQAAQLDVVQTIRLSGRAHPHE